MVQVSLTFTPSDDVLISIDESSLGSDAVTNSPATLTLNSNNRYTSSFGFGGNPHGNNSTFTPIIISSSNDLRFDNRSTEIIVHIVETTGADPDPGTGGPGAGPDPNDPAAGGGTIDPNDPGAGGGTIDPNDPEAGGGFV